MLCIRVDGFDTPLGMYDVLELRVIYPERMCINQEIKLLVMMYLSKLRDRCLSLMDCLVIQTNHPLYPILALILNDYEMCVEREVVMGKQHPPDDNPKPPKDDKHIKNKPKDGLDDDETDAVKSKLKKLKKDEVYVLDDFVQAMIDAGYGDYPITFLYHTLQMLDERVPHDESRTIYQP